MKTETIENYEESQFKMEKSIKTWGESTSLKKKKITFLAIKMEDSQPWVWNCAW